MSCDSFMKNNIVITKEANKDIYILNIENVEIRIVKSSIKSIIYNIILCKEGAFLANEYV